MQRILLDSDVVIANLRNDRPVTRFLDQLLEEGLSVCVCPIAHAEIYAGKRPGEEVVITGFFRALECLSIDEAVGTKAGEYLEKFSRSSGVKIADALVAAVAFRHDVALFTLNRKHYPMRDIQVVGVPTHTR